MSEYYNLEKMIIDFANESGPAGGEFFAAKYALKELEKYMPASVDALGNVIGEKSGEGPHILLDAHIDQVGMIVTSIDDGGFIKFDKCGGMDIRVLAAHEVIVWGKQPVFGVIVSTPPHLAKKDDEKKAKDFDELAVDIGMSKEKASEILSAGDRITLKSSHKKLLGNQICGPAFDDRAGAAAILRCLEILESHSYNCRLSVMFSVQEETGGSGAKTGGYSANAEESIVVDVSFAMAPDMPKEKCGEIGKGPMIGISPTLDSGMFSKLKKIAKANNIPCQCEVMGGRTGTNADEIQTSGNGTKTALLSIPLKNMHSGVEIIDLQDVENLAELLAAYIMKGDA